MDGATLIGLRRTWQRRVMSAEQFAGYMEKRLTVYDNIEVIDREGGKLRLRAGGADVTADLGTFYSAYLRDPNRARCGS
ncbi:MAG: hypothetical protein U0074_05245 [Kouleothrix sp.]